jgi:hypothetical protein
VIFFVTACGGPSDSADVPQAKIAGPTSFILDNHILYFSAQPTKRLNPAISEKYRIKRSNNRAMFNLSVIRKLDGISVSADITIKATNMTGQLKSTHIRKIKEVDNTILYIGDVNISNREVIIFNINVKPDGENKNFTVKFERQFYID